MYLISSIEFWSTLLNANWLAFLFWVGDNVATLVVGVVAADLGAAGRVHIENLAVADGAKLLLKQLGERGECLFVGGGHGSPFLGAHG